MNKNTKYNELLLFSKVRAVRNQLSAKEMVVADYILEHPEALENCTALSLAEAAGTSNATVVRFCRSCGFSGLNELKLYFRREYLSQEGLKKEISNNDSISVIKQKIQQYHETVMRNIVAEPNEDSFELAAEAIIKANKVLVAGFGGCSGAAVCFVDTFLSVGIPCEYYSDPVMCTYKTALLQPGDVMFVIMYTGSYRSLLDIMALAKKNGATIITVYGVMDTPVEKVSDILLRTTVMAPEHMRSAVNVRVAELITIEILFESVCSKMPEHGKERKTLDNSLEMHRVTGVWKGLR